MRKAALKTLGAAALLGLFTASCSTVRPLDTAKRELATAAECCASYAQFNFEPLNFGETENITIDRESPAFQFDTGKSYFKAFRLPVTAKPYSIIVQSYFIESTTRSASSFVFSPAVMFLDAGYGVTRRLDKGFYAAVDTGNSLSKARLEAEIPVNPRSAAEKFVVIYTTAALMEKATILKVYKYARYGTIVDDYPLPNAPVGELKVSLIPGRY